MRPRNENRDETIKQRSWEARPGLIQRLARGETNNQQQDDKGQSSRLWPAVGELFVIGQSTHGINRRAAMSERLG